MTTHLHTGAARAAHLGRLASYLQAIREQERADLARELHDELGSILMGAKLDVACLVTQLGGRSGALDQRLQHLSETLNRGIQLKARVVEGLSPSTLHNLGLVASLQILAREFSAGSGLVVDTRLEDVSLDPGAQLAVYRLVQEALTNIGKYAAATHAEVVLGACTEGVAVSVHDNGRGFDTATLHTSSHGLAGMRHRIEDCGGELTVASSSAQGTSISAVLPCGDAAPPGHAARPTHH